VAAIIRSWRSGGHKLSCDGIEVVVGDIVCHRARSLLGLDRVYHCVLVWRVFTYNSNRTIAAGCERKAGAGIETVGVDSRSDGLGSDDFPGGEINNGHQIIVAAYKEPLMGHIACHPRGLRAWCERPRNSSP